MSDAAIVRRMAAIIREIHRGFPGYNPYGIDWPTASAVFPELVAEYRELQRIGRKRPSLCPEAAAQGRLP